MRIIAMMMVVVGVLGACSSGDIELVQVENPSVQQAEGTTRATAIPQPSNDESPNAANTTESGSDSAASAPVQADDSGADTSANDDDNEDQRDADPDESLEEREPADESDLAEVDEENEDGVVDEVAKDEATGDPIDLDVGMVDVEPSDSWCDAAAKVNENFSTLNTIDHGDPQQLEAAFVQVYNAIEVAAEIAPAEIANDAEVERWVWEQMVTVHADAGWGVTPLPQARITELGEQNLGPLQAVDDYTARTC